MPLIEGSVDISVPRATVWNLLCDVPRYSEFGAMTDEAIPVSEGVFGLGSVYTETGKVAGMASTSEWTVTQFDPPSRQTHVGEESSMHADLTWILDEIDDSRTSASHLLDLKMIPGFRPLGVILEVLFVKRMMTKRMERIRNDLKRIAEESA